MKRCNNRSKHFSFFYPSPVSSTTAPSIYALSYVCMIELIDVCLFLYFTSYPILSSLLLAGLSLANTPCRYRHKTSTAKCTHPTQTWNEKNQTYTWHCEEDEENGTGRWRIRRRRELSLENFNRAGKDKILECKRQFVAGTKFENVEVRWDLYTAEALIEIAAKF